MLAKNISVEKVGNLPQAISGVEMCRHAKDLIQLLQSFAFRLGQEQQYENESDYVPSRVPAESTLGSEGGLQTRIGDGKYEIEKPGRGCGKRHTQRSDV